VNVCPLGSGALAGSTLPLDRELVAELLGFVDARGRPQLTQNSMDAVSDRDFAVEFCSSAALLGVHLSRLAEDLVLWSSAEFNFIRIADAYTTGSSLMPQKKNPDVAELIRGKSGRMIGNLVALLTLMKAQPLAYNKDNQEDKEPLFDAVDTVADTLRVFTGMLSGLTVNAAAMRRAAAEGHATATDLADYLVKKGLPFREAHEAVARVVRFAAEQGKDLAELPLGDLQRFSALIAPDVFGVLTLEGSLAGRNHLGGTAPAQVRAAIARARADLA
jgi:argininosuccinate lyase